MLHRWPFRLCLRFSSYGPEPKTVMGLKHSGSTVGKELLFTPMIRFMGIFLYYIVFNTTTKEHDAELRRRDISSNSCRTRRQSPSDDPSYDVTVFDLWDKYMDSVNLTAEIYPWDPLTMPMICRRVNHLSEESQTIHWYRIGQPVPFHGTSIYSIESST